jgi:hypothetical protein
VHKKKVFIALCLLSVLELIFVSVTGSLKQIIDAMPLAIALSVVSELLFSAGIVMMAIASEQSIGLNPLKWRSHLNKLIQDIKRSRLFIFGFWMNFVGALATGVIWLVVILLRLPPSGWFLLWLPIMDIALTLAVRKAFIDLVALPLRKKHAVLLDNSEDSHTI